MKNYNLAEKNTNIAANNNLENINEMHNITHALQNQSLNLFLIGPMAAGKTTIGKQLAKLLNLPFVDSDAEIESKAGASISWIFDVEGEAGFRQREEKMLAELTEQRGIVLSTGGGAIKMASNRAQLKANGIVIYLQTTVEKQLQRTRHDKKRPLLQTDSPRKVLEALAKERNPLYEETATITVSTDNKKPRWVATQILEKIEEYLAKKGVASHYNNENSTMTDLNTNILNSMSQANNVSQSADVKNLSSAQFNTSHSLMVNLADRSYPIHIEAGLFQDPQIFSMLKPQQKVMIVTNETVAPLYLDTIQSILIKQNITVHSVILPDGENYKTLETLNTVFTALLEQRFGRDGLLIALGGGVIGDLVGFAAATYQRGINFIQIPTTLLSQVDSSVGGKTAVNHPLGKNMIGAFYQPISVIIDSNCLDTLPEREFSAGLAEVIKYAIIFDYQFFQWLEENLDKLMARDKLALAYAIQRCCQLKAEVVGRDETEQGERALLNLGHTFGHAIEAELGYGVWLHGEAVASGMMMACCTAQRLGLIQQPVIERVKQLLIKAKLPVTKPESMQTNEFMPHMLRDKKVLAGKLRLIIPTAIGCCELRDDINHEIVLAAIEDCSNQ